MDDATVAVVVGPTQQRWGKTGNRADLGEI